MATVTHLKSLQALELAIRYGSLKAAADHLGITPAAVGQRIRSLEGYLGNDLLLRGRSGLQPTRELEHSLGDLKQAFAALERVVDSLDFQRTSEIHIVADPDWSELWLLPRLGSFRTAHPNILFCINGAGDVPLRLGSPDLRITYCEGEGEPLYRDVLVPVTGPDNRRRIADWDPVYQMEGMPLLHLEVQRNGGDHPGWVEWFAAFGQRASGPDRGVHYRHARLALEAVRQNVGFLLCGLSLIRDDVETEMMVMPFPATHHIPAPHPYRVTVRPDAERRPQVQRFLDWLMEQAAETRSQIETFVS